MAGEQIEEIVDIRLRRFVCQATETLALQLLTGLHAAERDLPPLRDARRSLVPQPFALGSDAPHAGLVSTSLRPLRQHHQQVRTGGRIRVHVKAHIDVGRLRLLDQAERCLVHRQVRDVDLGPRLSSDVEALAATLSHAAPVTALMRRVHAAGRGHNAAEIDQFAHGRKRARLVLEAGGHADRAGVEPLDQV